MQPPSSYQCKPRKSTPISGCNGFQSLDLGDDLPVSCITCGGMHLRERNGGATNLDESSMLPSLTSELIQSILFALVHIDSTSPAVMNISRR
jgi:hypothetical protein